MNTSMTGVRGQLNAALVGYLTLCKQEGLNPPGCLLDGSKDARVVALTERVSKLSSGE